jgi:hypothetical protein
LNIVENAGVSGDPDRPRAENEHFHEKWLAEGGFDLGDTFQMRVCGQNIYRGANILPTSLSKRALEEKMIS